MIPEKKTIKFIIGHQLMSYLPFNKLIKFSAILLTFSLLFSSCQLVLKTLYGVHSPRIVKSNDLIEHCYEYGIDTSYALLPSYEAFQYKFSKIASVNDLLLFDSSGQMLLSQEQTSCPSSYSHLIKDAFDTNSYSKIDSLSIDTLLSGLFHLDLSPFTPKIEKPFIAIIYSADFVGKVNATILDWNQQFKNKDNVQVFNIICDPNKNWTEQELKNLKKGF